MSAVVSAAPSNQAIGLDDFVAELDTLAAAIAQAHPQNLAELRARVPVRWVVTVGREPLEVSTRWIVNAIDESGKDAARWPAARNQLLARLAAMRQEAAGSSPAAEAADAAAAAQARSALAEVLTRREFERTRGSAWMNQLRERAAQWLLRLWQQVGGERLGRRQTAIVLAWLATLAALSVLAYGLVRGMLRASAGTALGLSPAQSRRRSARAWALEAVAAADPREAARCAYHAAVRRLEEEGAWRLDEARTPREYLRILPEHHARRAVLADITSRFEQIWYGAREATAEDSRTLIGQLKDLGCLPAG